MKIELWPTAKPVDYARNARKITPEAIEKIAASIKEFGFRQPVVVDGEGVIIIGHARRRAALKLELSEIPVHVATDLSAAKVKALRLADNRSGSEIKWDFELLATELEELKTDFNIDLALTAFDAHEIEPLLATDWNPAPEDESAPAEPKEAEPKPDMRSIMMTKEQHEVIGKAIFKVRQDEDAVTMSDGRALELICADFLSGGSPE
jgi:ParB-like chromosome segregation protein Spo0J